VVPKYTFEVFVDFVETNLSNTEVLLQIKNAMDIWADSEFIKTKDVESTKKKNTRGKK
jgi:hypothetical protein